MKKCYTSILILLLLNFRSFGQSLPGHYKDHFGNDLRIVEDSTYINTWSYDLFVIWYAGNWNIHQDTIYLTPKYFYDTLSCEGRDSLILSTDIVSNRINCEESRVINRTPQSDTLIYVKLVKISDRLYEVDKKGRLIKKLPGEEKRISIRKATLTKPEIVLFRWKKKCPAYYYRVID